MNAQNKFDVDYAYVRKLLIKGDCTLNAAKLWLDERAEHCEEQAVKEQHYDLSKWSSGADREEVMLNKLTESPVSKYIKGNQK